MALADIVVVTHPDVTEHVMPFPRPHLESFERPLRVQMILQHLDRCGFRDVIETITPRLATQDELATVHSRYLIELVMLMSKLGGGEVGDAAYASPALYRTARLAAGAAIEAAHLVQEGKARHAFSIMRPPGHHASTSTAMGLCYFNNVAIATRSLQKSEAKRVSILDFDDHHGNGTAEIFYADSTVQYISIHEYDFENPSSGHFLERGHGDGLGTNINIPLAENSPDESYTEALERVVRPAIVSFNPDIIAVSAGYDAHYGDPVGNMNVDSSTFWRIGRLIRELVEETDASGSFWVLEGGYNPFLVGLSVEASMRGLAGERCPRLHDQVERIVDEDIVRLNAKIIDEVERIVKKQTR